MDSPAPGHLNNGSLDRRPLRLRHSPACLISFPFPQLPRQEMTSRQPVVKPNSPLNREKLPLNGSHLTLKTENLPLNGSHLALKKESLPLNGSHLALSRTRLPEAGGPCPRLQLPAHRPTQREDRGDHPHRRQRRRGVPAERCGECGGFIKSRSRPEPRCGTLDDLPPKMQDHAGGCVLSCKNR